jgi:hypothetical protein
MEDVALESFMFAQRCNLTEHEKNHILEIIPPLNTCIGVSYVNEQTSTNFKRNTIWYVSFNL